jgi:hypothetical protein
MLKMAVTASPLYGVTSGVGMNCFYAYVFELSTFRKTVEMDTSTSGLSSYSLSVQLVIMGNEFPGEISDERGRVQLFNLDKLR